MTQQQRRQAAPPQAEQPIAERVIHDMSRTPAMMAGRETAARAFLQEQQAALEARRASERLAATLGITPTRTAEAARADFDQAAGAMRARLAALREHNVGVESLDRRNQQIVQILERQLGRIEERARSGDTEGAGQAMRAFSTVMNGVARTASIVANMVREGAPPQLAERVDQASAFDVGGASLRARALRRVGEVFTARAAVFRAREGEGVTRDLAQEALRLTSVESNQTDLTREQYDASMRTLETISTTATSIGNELNRLYQSTLTYYLQTLAEVLTRDVSDQVKQRIRRLIQDVTETRDRYGREGETPPTEAELGSIASRIRTAQEAADALSDKTTLTAEARRHLETVYVGALDALAAGRTQAGETLSAAADEIRRLGRAAGFGRLGRDARRAVSEYLSSLARAAGAIASAETPEARAEAEGTMRATIARRLAGELQGAARTLGGESERLLNGIIGQLGEHPERATMDNLRALAGALSACQKMLGFANVRMPEEQRQALTGIFNRGLQAIAGGDLRSAGMQFRLMDLYASRDATATQRSELNQLSQMLATQGAAALDVIDRYMRVNDRITNLRTQAARGSLGRSERAEFDRLISEMERMRANLAASGSMVSDEEAAAHVTALRARMRENREFRDTIANLVRVNRREGETEEQAEARILDYVARGELEEAAQRRFDEMGRLADSFLSSLGARQGRERTNVVTIFRNAISALLGGNMEDARRFRSAGEAYASLRDPRDRRTLMDILAGTEGRPAPRAGQSVFTERELRMLDVLGQWSRFDETVRGTGESRNARAYFDLAMWVARQGTREEFQLVMDMASAYGAIASVDPRTLPSEMREQRSAEMRRIQGALGDFSREARRLSDIGADRARGGWRPREGQLTPLAGAIVLEGSFTRRLGEGDASLAPGLSGDALAEAQTEAGARRLVELQGQADAAGRLAQSLGFEVRCRQAEGPASAERATERRYQRVAADLRESSEEARAAGDLQVADFYSQEAARVDRGFVRTSVGAARSAFARGQDALEEARGLVREADDAATKSADQMRTRIGELRAALPPARQAEVDQMLRQAGTDEAQVRVVYTGLLRLRAQERSREGTTLVEDAGLMLDGISSYDRSVRSVTTIHSYSGRRELQIGVLTLAAVSEGYDVDLLGQPVMVREAPAAAGAQPQEVRARASVERLAALRGNGRGQVAVGLRSVEGQERIMRARWSTVTRAQREVRDANETRIRGIIDNMLQDGGPGNPPLIADAGARERFRARLAAIGGVTDREQRARQYQQLYLEVGRAAGVRTESRGAPEWLTAGGRGVRGETLYDAEAHYRRYRTAVGLAYRERFDAASTHIRSSSIEIRESGALATNRVNERRLTLARDEARGNSFGLAHLADLRRWGMVSEGVGIWGNTYDTMFEHVMRTPAVAMEQVGAMIEHLPPAERESYRARLDSALRRGVERRSSAVLDIWMELASRHVNPPQTEEPGRMGRRSTTLLDAVVGQDLFYYDADGLERRILRARGMRREGNSTGAESEMDGALSDMAVLETAERRGIERTRDERTFWARYHERHPSRRRGFGEAGRTARERLTREIPRRPDGEEVDERTRGAIEDNNAAREPEIRGIEASADRSIGYMRSSVRASSAAIDELLMHREPVDIASPEIAQELYFALPEEAQRRYRQYIDRLPSNGESTETAEARRAALEFYNALRGNSADFGAAVGRMRRESGPGGTFSNMVGVLAQLEADQATLQYRTWDYNEAYARQTAEFLVQYAGTELDRMENAENRRYLTSSQEHHDFARTNRYGWAPHGGEYRASYQHRERATRALEFASALLEEGNARRAADIIQNNEVLTARGMYRETRTPREWHDDHGLRLGLAHRQGNEYGFRATDQLCGLIYRGRMEVLSYYDEDAMAAARPRMQQMAEMEIEHTLRSLGIQRTVGADDEIYYERWQPPSEEAAQAFADSGRRLMNQLGEHDSFILGQSDASLLLGSWIGSEEIRYNEATFAIADRSWRAAMRASRGEVDGSRTLLARVDELTPELSTARGQVQDWASYQRAAGLGIDIVAIAGTAIFAPEFLPATFMMMGARGVGEGLEMRRQAGEWTGEAIFATSMGAAGMVLVPLSEAASLMRAAQITRGLARGAQWAERAVAAEEAMAVGFRGSRLTSLMSAGQAERTALMEAAQALGEGRTVLTTGGQMLRAGTPEAAAFLGQDAGFLVRAGQYVRGGAELTAFQRAVHIAGLGMMGAGGGQFLYHLPQQLDALGSGQTTLLEVGLGAWLSVGQAVGQGAYAIRAAGSAGPTSGYIPRPMQYLAAAAFGIPLTPRPAHVMARDSALAARELARMPAQERTSYEAYRDRNRITLDPSEERAIVRDYNEARTRAESRGETLTFDSYMQRPTAEGARRLSAAALESGYQLYRAGQMPASDLTPALRAYSESRAGGAEPLDAAAAALRAPAQPQPAEAPAGPSRAASMAARRERAGAAARLETERRQYGQDIAPHIDRVATDSGATIPPALRASAADLAFHAERLATAPPGQRAEVRASIPERLRTSAEVLSREPEFRDAIIGRDGARLETPDRSAQMRAALEEAATMPAHSGMPETSRMRLALNTERIIGMRDLTAEDLSGHAERYERRAGSLREEGRTAEADAWARSAGRLRAEAARRAPAAPGEEARAAPAPRPRAAPAEEHVPAAPRARPPETAAARSRRDAVADAPAQDQFSPDAVARRIFERSRQEGREAWTTGGPLLETGTILRSVEDYVLRLARAGEERDVVVLTGDKTLLNAINEFLGREWGDIGLDAYQAILQRAISRVIRSGGGTRPGEDVALVRPSARSDETVSVLVLRRGRGEQVRANLQREIEAATRWVMESPESPFRAQFARIRGLVRDPAGLAAASTERSRVIRIRRDERGRVTATYAGGENAFIRRPEGRTEFLTAAVTRTDDPHFAGGLRREVHLREDPNVRPALEPYEQGRVQDAWQRREAPRSDAERAMVARMEAVLRESGAEPSRASAEQVEAAIMRVAWERANLPERGVVGAEGVALEIRLSVTDPATLARLRGLLPETGKGLAEVLANRFGIRGFNTFFGHDGANAAINLVEAAVASYATRHNLTIRRMGTLKYVIEGGTPELARGLQDFISEHLQTSGTALGVARDIPVIPVGADTSVATALAHVANGHMVVERRSLERRFPHLAGMTDAEIRATDWDGEIQRYADANALINAMGNRMASDALLRTLLGDSYDAMAPIIQLVRGRRDIRNFEDLVLALRDPQIGGAQGRVLEGAFRRFVVEEGRAFRLRVEAIPRPMRPAESEAQAVRLRLVAGGEAEAAAGGRARREEAPRPALPFREREVHRMEREVGAIPQPRADAVFSRGPPELLAIARVLDSMVPGSTVLSEGGLRNLMRRYPEYAEALRAMNEIEPVGRDLVIEAHAPRILFERASLRLEHAIAGAGDSPAVAETARLMLRGKHGLVQSFSEMGSLDLNVFTRVQERMALGMGEADAILSVAREINGGGSSPPPSPSPIPTGPRGGGGPGRGRRPRGGERPVLRVVRPDETAARAPAAPPARTDARAPAPVPEALVPGGFRDAARRAAGAAAERRTGPADLAARREAMLLEQAQARERTLVSPRDLAEFARMVANGEQVQAGRVRLSARDLLSRMDVRVQGEVLALANDAAFAQAARRPAAGGDDVFRHHLQGRRAEVEARAGRIRGAAPAEREAAARTGTDDAAAAPPSAVGRLAEAGPIAPGSIVAMSGPHVSPSRYNHLLGAYQHMEAGRPSGAGPRTERLARQAYEQVRRGVPREQAVANILDANPPRGRDDLGSVAMELFDVAEAMVSGNPERVAAARRHFETLGAMQRDALLFLISEGSGFSQGDAAHRAVMAERLARSIELEQGGLVEPLSRDRVVALARAADRLVYEGNSADLNAIARTMTGPEALAFSRIGRMMVEARRSGAGRAQPESFIMHFAERLAPPQPPAGGRAPPALDAQAAQALADYEAMSRPRPAGEERARIHNPAAIRLHQILRENPRMPREQAARQAAEDVNAATRLTAEYEMFLNNSRQGLTVIQSPEGRMMGELALRNPDLSPYELAMQVVSGLRSQGRLRESLTQPIGTRPAAAAEAPAPRPAEAERSAEAPRPAPEEARREWTTDSLVREYIRFNEAFRRGHTLMPTPEMTGVAEILRQHPDWSVNRAAAEYLRRQRAAEAPEEARRPAAPEEAPRAPAAPEERPVPGRPPQELLGGREALDFLSRRGITPSLDDTGAIRMFEREGRRYAEFNYTEGEATTTVRIPMREQAPGEPSHIYQHRLRAEALDGLLRIHEESIRGSAPEASTLRGRRLYTVAYDMSRAPDARLGYGTPNERAVARQLRGDQAYADAMAQGDYAAALAITERYSTLLGSMERSTTRTRRGEHVDEVTGARRVIAIGDVHGDAHALVDQLVRGGVLVDTMPHLAADDASVPLARRYRINPDLAQGTQIVFTGDYIDRGPTSIEVVELVRQMQSDAGFAGSAVHTIRGNHEALFIRFVDAYRGYTTEQVREIIRTGNLPDGTPDPNSMFCQWNRIGMGIASQKGVPGTFEQIVARFGTWENFIARNFTSEGVVIPGSEMDFIHSTRGAVIIDNNYFTHGGPVMTEEVRTAPTREAALAALDDHFTGLFGTRDRPIVDNNWATTWADQAAFDRGDHSSNYVNRWYQELGGADGQQFRQALGIDQVYIGHMPTEGGQVTRFGDFATGIDVGMTAHYGGGRGFLDIDPVRRDAPVAARAEASGPGRNLTGDRTRTTVLRNPVSDAAAAVLDRGEAVPLPPEAAAEPPAPQQRAPPPREQPPAPAPELREATATEAARPLSGDEYRARLAMVPEHYRPFVEARFAEAPDAGTMGNALALFGERSGERSGVFGDFHTVLRGESIGGNAGPGHAGVNGYYDPQTGRITAFGNVQNIPPEIVARGRIFHMRVNVMDGTIVQVFGEGAPVPPQVAALNGMQVVRGMREALDAAHAAPARPAPAAAEYTPLRLRFQESDVPVVSLERHLPRGSDERTGYIRRLSRDLYRYAAGTGEVPEMYRPAVEAIRANREAGAQAEGLAVQFATMLVDTSGMVRPGSAAAMEASSGNMQGSRPLEAALPREGANARDIRRVARVLERLDDSIAAGRMGPELADPEYQAALRAIGPTRGANTAQERAVYTRQWAEYIVSLRGGGDGGSGGPSGGGPRGGPGPGGPGPRGPTTRGPTEGPVARAGWESVVSMGLDRAVNPDGATTAEISPLASLARRYARGDAAAVAGMPAEVRAEVTRLASDATFARYARGSEARFNDYIRRGTRGRLPGGRGLIDNARGRIMDAMPVQAGMPEEARMVSGVGRLEVAGDVVGRPALADAQSGNGAAMLGTLRPILNMAEGGGTHSGSSRLARAEVPGQAETGGGTASGGGRRRGRPGPAAPAPEQRAAAPAERPVVLQTESNIRQISGIEIDGRRPWQLSRGREQVGAVLDDALGVFREAYGNVGLRYSNPRELIGRMDAVYIARDAQGRAIAFATFSESPRGLRLALCGALPGSREGRAAVRQVLQRFSAMEGAYGNVSGRVADIVIREMGMQIVPYDQARSMMGGSRRGGANAQRDAQIIRQRMGDAAFAESPIVRAAMERTGRSAREITFDDLVAQAVHDGEIPNTDAARANCFALVQSLEGPGGVARDTVEIKLMVGRPLAEQARAETTAPAPGQEAPAAPAEVRVAARPELMLGADINGFVGGVRTRVPGVGPRDVTYKGTFDAEGGRLVRFQRGGEMIDIYAPEGFAQMRPEQLRQHFEDQLVARLTQEQRPAEPETAAPPPAPAPAAPAEAARPVFDRGLPRSTREQQARGITPMDAIGMEPRDTYFRENSINYNGVYEQGGRRYAEFTLRGEEGTPQVRVYLPDEAALSARGITRRQYFEQALRDARAPAPAEPAAPAEAARPVFEMNQPRPERDQQVRGLTPVDAIGMQPGDPYFRENSINYGGVFEAGGRRFAEFTLRGVEGTPRVRVYMPDDATLAARGITRRQYFEQALLDARTPRAAPEPPAAAPGPRPAPSPAEAPRGPAPAEAAAPPSTRRMRIAARAEAAGRSLRDATVQEHESFEALLLRGETPLAADVASLIPEGEFSRPLRGIARMLQELAGSGRPLERIDAEYRDAVSAIRAASPAERAQATATRARAIFEGRGGELGYTVRRAVDGYVRQGRDRARATTAVEQALLLPARYREGFTPADATDSFFMALIDSAVSRQPGRPREVIAFEVGQQAAAAAAGIMRRSMLPEGGVRRPADGGEAFAFDMAMARARERERAALGGEEGRAVVPTQEDFIFGAAALGMVLERMRAGGMEAFAPQILTGTFHFLHGTPMERMPAVLDAYLRAAGTIAERVPASVITGEEQVNASQSLFNIAAYLLANGVADPQALFTNASRTGLLDMFTIESAGHLNTVAWATTFMGDIAYRVIGGNRPELIAPTLRLILEDAARLNPDMREAYLHSVGEQFSWSDQLGTRIAELDSRTGASARRKRMPMLAMTMDPSMAPLLAILDTSVVRNRLSTDSVFREFTAFLENMRHADMDVEGQAWLSVVRENIEYLGMSMEQRMARGISEEVDPSRTSFITDRVRHLNTLYGFHREGRIQPDTLRLISESLTGMLTTEQFSSTMGRGYRSLVPELSVSDAWVSAHLDLFAEYVSYRRTLSLLAGLAGRFPDYAGRPEAFREGLALLDRAFIAHVEGRFAEFKFSPEFRAELRESAARAGVDGDAVFRAWSSERQFRVSAEGQDYQVHETGTFDAGFYSGMVRGATACQSPRNMHPTVGGIVGSVVQPWMRQVVIGPPGSAEATYRRWMVLVQGEDGRPILLLQPAYQLPGTPASVDAAVIAQIRQTYEPLGVEVRDVRAGVAERTDDAGRPSNRGYGTYQFRAPFAYLDSNMVEVFWGGKRAQNGLLEAPAGQRLEFPAGSRRTITR